MTPLAAYHNEPAPPHARQRQLATPRGGTPSAPPHLVDALVYDLGMHRGEDTDYYLKRGCRVVGVEADPEHAAFCRSRFAQAIAEGQLILLEGAIAATRGPYVTFYRNLDNPVWGTVDPEWVARNERRATRHQEISVRVVSLRDCFAEYGMPYYMKIDLEGSDRLALHALENCEVRPSYLSHESEMKSFARLDQDIRLLQSLGYNSFRAVQQADMPARTQRLRLPGGISHKFEYGSSGPLPEEYPARWEDADGLRRTYRWIFLLYRLFGTDSWLWRHSDGRALIWRLGELRQAELPGWYDTHARHCSVHG